MANILIVEDDPAAQITIRLLLEKGLALFEASQFQLLPLRIKTWTAMSETARQPA